MNKMTRIELKFNIYCAGSKITRTDPFSLSIRNFHHLFLLFPLKTDIALHLQYFNLGFLNFSIVEHQIHSSPLMKEMLNPIEFF